MFLKHTDEGASLINKNDVPIYDSFKVWHARLLCNVLRMFNNVHMGQLVIIMLNTHTKSCSLYTIKYINKVIKMGGVSESKKKDGNYVW